MGIPYNPTIPVTNDDPADDQPLMQTNFASINTLINVDHVGFSNAQYGQHNQVTFAANNVPTTPTVPPVLFTNTVGAVPQPFFYSGSTFNQYTNAANGSTFLLGGMILKWGLAFAITDNASVSFVTPFPNSCYAVYLTIVDPNATSKTENVKSGTLSPSGFNVRVSSGAVSVYYLAIGF